METYYILFGMTPQARSLNNTTLAGVIGAVGLIIQIIIGFALAGSGNPTGSVLILPHMLIGIAGIALVAFLVSTIFLNPSPMIPTLVYALAFVLTLAQVALGFRELSVPDQMLLMTHEGLAVVILVLFGLGGMLTARSRRKSMTVGTPGQQVVA
jgi:hypothetical protein